MKIVGLLGLKMAYCSLDSKVLIRLERAHMVQMGSLGSKRIIGSQWKSSRLSWSYWAQKFSLGRAPLKSSVLIGLKGAPCAKKNSLGSKELIRLIELKTAQSIWLIGLMGLKSSLH